MWKKAVGILLALSVAGAFFYYGLTQAHAADDDWTIGVTRTVHHAFVCQNKEAAESVGWHAGAQGSSRREDRNA